MSQIFFCLFTMLLTVVITVVERAARTIVGVAVEIVATGVPVVLKLVTAV